MKPMGQQPYLSVFTMTSSVAESNDGLTANMSRYTNEGGVAKHERVAAVGLTFRFHVIFHTNSVNILCN